MLRWLPLLLLALPVYASDTHREARWAEQIVDAILVGEPEWLPLGEQQFLGIYTEAEVDQPRGAVILAHGIGVHPDWEDVIRPLREALPEQGWATLSIQMPILDAEAQEPEYFALFPEALPRLDAAEAWLREQGYRRIVLIGHSMGSQMGVYWVSQHRGPALK